MSNGQELYQIMIYTQEQKKLHGAYMQKTFVLIRSFIEITPRHSGPKSTWSIHKTIKEKPRKTEDNTVKYDLKWTSGNIREPH